MNHASKLFTRHAMRAIENAEQAMQRIRIGMPRDDDDATIAAADVACEFAGLLYRDSPGSMGCTYAPIMRRDSIAVAKDSSAILARLIGGRPGDQNAAAYRPQTRADLNALLTVFHYAHRL